MHFASYALVDRFLEREYTEKAHSFRNDFQRDRDRIIHSKAFRRLEYKTQVFVNHAGDHFRTRLTHSLEVSQIARTVARALGLNEDLTETIALAHDIGHPPFGHAGEKALDSLLKPGYRFDHNEQALRIVTTLEKKYPHYDGLNLTRATLMGLRKHDKLPGGMSHSLEAQVVDTCDEIAYNCHDVQDGLENGFLTREKLSQVAIWQKAEAACLEQFGEMTAEISQKMAVRWLINHFVLDLVASIKNNLGEYSIKSLDDVLEFRQRVPGSELVSLSSETKEMAVELKKFLFQNLYRHSEIVTMNKRAGNIIRRIFRFVSENADAMPEQFTAELETTDHGVVIADFISGMTDRYAEKWNRMILGIE